MLVGRRERTTGCLQASFFFFSPFACLMHTTKNCHECPNNGCCAGYRVMELQWKINFFLSVLRNNLKRWLTWRSVLEEDQFKFSVDNKLLFSVVFEEPRNSTVQYFWLLVRQTSTSALCGMLPSNLSWNIVSRMAYCKRVAFDFDSRLWSCWAYFEMMGMKLTRKNENNQTLTRAISGASVLQGWYRTNQNVLSR